MSVIDRDKGYKALQRRLADLSVADAMVAGILRPNVRHRPPFRGLNVPLEGRRGIIRRLFQNLKKGLRSFPTVGRVAGWLEFGNGRNAPARPFVRTGWDQEQKGLELAVSRGMKGVLKGTTTRREVLEKAGKRASEAMKKVILARIPPENADSTIKQKGSDIPNIDTAQVFNAIGYEVDARRVKKS